MKWREAELSLLSESFTVYRGYNNDGYLISRLPIKHLGLRINRTNANVVSAIVSGEDFCYNSVLP